MGHKYGGGGGGGGGLGGIAGAYAATVGTPLIGTLGTVTPDAAVTLSNSGSTWLAVSVGASAGAANSITGYTKSLTMTSGQRVAFLVSMDATINGSGSYSYFGYAFGFTDGTKFHVFTAYDRTNDDVNQGATIMQWSSSTAYGSNVNVNKPNQPIGRPVWFGIRYDGTNYNYEFSTDRVKWLPLGSFTASYLSSYTTLFFGAVQFAGATNAAVKYFSVDTNS